MTEPTQANYAAPPPLTAHNGAYTVDHREAGHFTLKLFTATRGELAGKRILALLVGPNNRTNFKGVAFWDDARKRVNVWNKHKGPDSHSPINGFYWQEKGWSTIEKKLAIWCDLVVRGSTDAVHGYWHTEDYRLMLESVCVMCNKKLTEPESIRIGIGPTCRGKL